MSSHFKLKNFSLFAGRLSDPLVLQVKTGYPLLDSNPQFDHNLLLRFESLMQPQHEHKLDQLLQWLDQYAEQLKGTLRLHCGPIDIYIESIQPQQNQPKALRQHVHLRAVYRNVPIQKQPLALKRLLTYCNPFQGSRPFFKPYLIHADLSFIQLVPLSPLKPDWRRQLVQPLDALWRAVEMEQ